MAYTAPAGDQAAFLRAWPQYSATPRGAALTRGLGQPPAATDLSGLDEEVGRDATQVEVVARIAFSGGPIAAEGDLEVSSGKLQLSPVDPRNDGVGLIDCGRGMPRPYRPCLV